MNVTRASGCHSERRHIMQLSPSTTVHHQNVLQVRHKKKLEERLAEVEQALRIFSQRRVLVKSDGAA